MDSTLAAATLLLALPLALAPDAVALDDPYEENDTCADAAHLVLGPPGGLDTFSFVSTGAAGPGGVDEDWFSFDVPAGHRLRIWTNGQFPGGPGVRLTLFRGANCGTIVQQSLVAAEVLEAVNSSGATERYVLGFVPEDPSFVSETLQMQVRLDPMPCAGFPDDPLEPNETVATAAALAPGLHRRLTLNGASGQDVYEVAVPIGDALRIGFGYVGTNGTEVRCRVLGRAWNGILPPFAQIASMSGIQTVVNTGLEDRLWVEVEVLTPAPIDGYCATYDLFLETVPTPCSGGPDALELGGNATVQTATPVAPGTYTDLWVGRLDRDVYAVDLPPRTGYRVRLNPTEPGTAIRVFGFGASGMQIGDGVEAAGGPADLVQGYTGATPERRFFQVTESGGAGLADCAPYGFEVSLSPALGTGTVCDGNGGPGTTAALELFGDADPLADDLFVVASDVPHLASPQVSVLFVGLAAAAPPAANNELCLDDPVGRWVVFGERTGYQAPLDATLMTAFTGTTAATQLFTATGGQRFLSPAITFQVP